MANQRMAEIFGYASAQDFLTAIDNIIELYAYPEERQELLQTLDKAGMSNGRQIQFKRKDGQRIWVKLNSKVTSTSNGQYIYEDLIEDITDFKKMEAQLQRVQKMEAIGTLAGGIAHDFNNLMMAMLGNISLILHDMNPIHPHHEKLKNVEELIQSGSKLTNQLLGFARKGKYDVKPIPLNNIVQENAETFGRARKEITIHEDLDKKLFAVMGDESQIQQVLLNLYVNTADAMPSGGDLFLKTMNVTHAEMKDKSYDPKPGNYVLLKISDNGTGIKKKIIDRIFDPFFTTKEMVRGTGLGLASVYGIIKGHGGYIDVDSKKGHGTTFSIYLPASDKDILEAPEISHQVKKGTGTILLVDDEAMVLEVGVQMIKKLGYTVLETEGSREAIEIYEKHTDDIDMVILDMVMPTLGGGDTYDRLKKINPDIKVLLSSGYRINGKAAEILERGCDGFIQKPFNLKDLSLKIGEVLDT
ncbi:MAG: response regulator [Desulfobacterales bacterium]|nr:MAG: response regulator [Desulfobacterales bacterium]